MYTISGIATLGHWPYHQPLWPHQQDISLSCDSAHNSCTIAMVVLTYLYIFHTNIKHNYKSIYQVIYCLVRLADIADISSTKNTANDGQYQKYQYHQYDTFEVSIDSTNLYFDSGTFT